MRGGTFEVYLKAAGSYISIHPPRAGRDAVMLSIRPKWCISIHPPRAGRDPMPLAAFYSKRYFNPPAPCGAGRNKPK